jgi:hypothetical protein
MSIHLLHTSPATDDIPAETPTTTRDANHMLKLPSSDSVLRAALKLFVVTLALADALDELEVTGKTVLVGADTPLSEAATLNGALPMLS